MSGPDLAPFYRLIELGRIGSTNDEARRLAASGAPEGTLVWAREQSGGRGRRGRAWISPPGNLYLSLLLRPRCSAAAAAGLGFAAAVAIGEACARFLPGPAAIAHKWPNDVLIDGRKVAGVLLESQTGDAGGPDWVVLGIGVNLLTHPAATEFPATSLLTAGAGRVEPAALLTRLAACWLAWYEAWDDGAGFAAVRAAWLLRAWGVGREIRARLPQGEERGVFAGLDAEGGLLLDAPAGRRRIAAAEIFPAA